MTGASSSSTEGPPGFALARPVGRRTWRAVQLGLERPVALRRLDPDEPFDARDWPDRPGVVALYAVVTGTDGTYVATRWLPGARTLAELERPRAVQRRRWCDAVAQALDGAVHGALTAADVLVDADGTAWVTWFGRASAGASADDDRAALDRLRTRRRSRTAGDPFGSGDPSAEAMGLGSDAEAASLDLAGAGGGRPFARGGRPALALGGAAAGLLVGVGSVLFAGGAEAPPRLVSAPAPPVTQGARAFGSALAPGGVRTVDCDGRPPSGSSPSCTLMPVALPGRPLEVPADGIVRAWAVRGVRGRVALQILVRRGSRYVAVNRTPPIAISDPAATRVIRSDRSVPAGARFALELDPGTGVGVRTSVPGAATARFAGLLRSLPAAPDPSGGAGRELLLRVDVVPRP